MAATWPATIPAPLLKGYSTTATQLVARADLGTGYAMHRRWMSGTPVVTQAKWRLTREQTRDLMQFARDNADKWFLIHLLRADQVALVEVYARLASDLELQPVSDEHDEVSVTLEVQNI